MPAPGLEFINFIIKLAANRTRLAAYLKDPAGVARAAGLSDEQVSALVSEGEVRLNELVKTDLSEWLLAEFQGAPLPTGRRKQPNRKAAKKPAKR